MAGRYILKFAVLTLVYLQMCRADSDSNADLQPEHGSVSYEIYGTNAEAGSSSENGIEKNYYQRLGMMHSRRQRRSPHFGLLGHAPHTHYRPVIVQQYQYPHHHVHGGYGHGLHHHQIGHSSNSHSQAQAVAVNFGAPGWNAGFSGAAASAGSGASQLKHVGYHRK